ncbi:MAG: aldo/keto reductase [Vampirovibrionales bacterium]|nr:aldo/keto reductase [Vampirovibrionales bacterium]
MRYRTLGKTGLSVSEIGFGGWEIGGDSAKGFGPADESDSLLALNAAYDAGCTFFDTADVYGYGQSERLIAKALKGWQRDRVTIASKVGMDFSEALSNPSKEPHPLFSQAHLERACEESLKRLGVEAIDLYQLHTPSLALIQAGHIFQVLKNLKAQGKIRFYGISIHDPQEGIQAISVGEVDCVQVAINLFGQRPLEALLDCCRENNIGLIAREALAQGFLSGRFDIEEPLCANDVRAVWPKPLRQRRLLASEKFLPLLDKMLPYPGLYALALRYGLSFPEVSTVLAGSKNAHHTRENMAAADLEPLSRAGLESIQAIQKTLL